MLAASRPKGGGMLLIFLVIAALLTAYAVGTVLAQIGDPPASTGVPPPTPAGTPPADIPAGRGPDGPGVIDPSNSDNYVSSAPVTPPPDAPVPDMQNVPPPFPGCIPIPGQPGWYCNGPADPPLPEPVQVAPPLINGKTQQQVTDILYNHFAELADIQGFQGFGVSQDGIVINVSEPHGVFPDAIEDIPVRLALPIQAQSLVPPVPADQQ